MKVLFRGVGNVLRCAIQTSTGCFFLLCVFSVSFLAGPAYSQERDNEALGNSKLLYGLHLGFTLNQVDLYYSQDGAAHALEEGNHSLCVPGFRMAVIGEVPLGRCFSLRAMPGVSLFSSRWEPKDLSLTAMLLDEYKVESVCGELPVDVKFRAFRIGKLEPYVAAGLNYRFDFSSRRNDSDKIQPLNAHDLQFMCGLGLDWYTPYLKIGFEFKASHGLFSPGTGGGDPFYFHNGSAICLGINIEA